MSHAKILDCTLRDGAYVVDKKFGAQTINGVIAGLMKAKIDVIEIGFLQDDEHGEGKTVFLNGKDAGVFIPKDKQGLEFTVLADYSRYSIENLDDNSGHTFDAVRACFFKHERYDAVAFCKAIKDKGYQVYVQPVDAMGYTDTELIELIELMNVIEPHCFSIVDTFGSMYMDDLHRVYSLVDHNLVKTSKIGFHSHNNMQMSAALSQGFSNMNYGKREIVIDSTISGMGRGAGNTPTELIAQYMVSKLNYTYEIDAILDIIDGYMDRIKAKYDWGYSTHYFLAGAYSAHVNNIAYLKQKNSIRSKDIRYILNKIGAKDCKRYEYDVLENTYMEYLDADIDDTNAMKFLEDAMQQKEVLVIAPGKTAKTELDKIQTYIKRHNPVIITINFIPEGIRADYIYMSNVKRYQYWKNSQQFESMSKIITSNVTTTCTEKEHIVSFAKLIKCGWEHMDNSMILVLRLLDQLAVAKVVLAGFDGYDTDAMKKNNYASEELESSTEYDTAQFINQEIREMLVDYKETRSNQCDVEFITSSRFEGAV